MKDINAGEMISRLQNGEKLNLLDVREKLEYHTYNIGGKNIPLHELKENFGQLEWPKNDEIIVICKAGIRSATAKSLLEVNGYKNIRNLTGGLLAVQREQ
ncbi:MAG: rhodanese-like domain-containing protein [Mucilaginibacter sp.]